MLAAKSTTIVTADIMKVHLEGRFSRCMPHQSDDEGD
jgi:hypothetical protein